MTKCNIELMRPLVCKAFFFFSNIPPPGSLEKKWFIFNWVSNWKLMNPWKCRLAGLISWAKNIGIKCPSPRMITLTGVWRSLIRKKSFYFTANASRTQISSRLISVHHGIWKGFTWVEVHFALLQLLKCGKPWHQLPGRHMFIEMWGPYRWASSWRGTSISPCPDDLEAVRRVGWVQGLKGRV